MSKSTADPVGRVATGALSGLLLSVIGIWRLGIEFEDAWLRSLNAPPAPWETALGAPALQANERAVGLSARGVQSREPVAA